MRPPKNGTHVEPIRIEPPRSIARAFLFTITKSHEVSTGYRGSIVQRSKSALDCSHYANRAHNSRPRADLAPPFDAPHVSKIDRSCIRATIIIAADRSRPDTSRRRSALISKSVLCCSIGVTNRVCHRLIARIGKPHRSEFEKKKKRNIYNRVHLIGNVIRMYRA